MKTIRFSLACFFCLFFLIDGVFAQSCYVRLDDDASGYTPTAGQIAELEMAACELIDSLPEEFQGLFKVYDFGFYLHQEVTQGWYPEPFTQKILEVEQLSPYYLLFGKQTDKSGVYTKLWVALKMPDSLQFSCMTALQREVYFKRVQTTTEERYLELDNSHTEYHRAEIAGIKELLSIIVGIKDCCIARAGNRSSSCNGCSDEIANSYSELSGFRKINLEATSVPYVNITTPLIRDYSFHKIKLSGQFDFTANHLNTVIDELNNFYSLNLLVTSNESLCIDSISGENQQGFKEEKDFFCHVNITTQGTGIILTFINVLWNLKPNSCLQDPETAKIIIENIYCRIYQELEIENENCKPYDQPPPWEIEFKSGWPAGGMKISEFIQLVRNEEEKYTEEERQDTKTMITRFRKLFYGSPAWDDYLIPGAESTPCIKPYEINTSENSRKVVSGPLPLGPLGPVFVMVDNGFYPVDPTTGQRPAINAVTNGSPQTQEIRLEQGSHNNMMIDIGHTLAGLDAFNNPSPVEVLGGYVTIGMNRNIDAVTWLGDLGSVLAEVRAESLMKGRGLNPIEIQDLINHYASPPDMLGNVDGIVIAINYLSGTGPPNLKKISDILTHYYLGDGVNLYQEKRYTYFSENIGLVWDVAQNKFSNREEWKKNWVDQTNDSAALYLAIAAKGGGLLINTLLCASGTILTVSMKPGIPKDLLESFVKKLEELRQQEP